MPLSAAGWSFLPEVALRDTAYTISQTPRLTGPFTTPVISHSALNRTDLEASIDIRPPALERDYELPFWHRELRHVIEPDLNYRYVGGIGAQAQNVLLFDTTDIAASPSRSGFICGQRAKNHAAQATRMQATKPMPQPIRRVQPSAGARRASGRAGRSRRSTSSIRTLAERSFPAGAMSSMPRWT
jgi:LPS-assembly protein